MADWVFFHFHWIGIALLPYWGWVSRGWWDRRQQREVETT